MIPKFDVWCIDHNEWERHKTFIDGNGILWHEAHNTSWYGFIPLKPETHVVVWHTGKTDKNGTPIRGGDIVRKEECAIDDPAFGYYGSIGVVKYDPDGMGFIIDSEDDGFYDNTRVNFSFGEIEVIGNVYENPEIIEATTK